MKTINYYQPIIRAVAKNGSERLGVHAVTKIWDIDSPEIKIDLEVYGKNSKEALEKLKASMISEKNTENFQAIELPCEYYLCSEEVIKKFKPFEVSKPFKSGYEWDKDLYYVAWLHFPEVEKHYNEVLGEDTEVDFWCRECHAGTMDVSKISMKQAKKNGLFREIGEKLNITAERNRAMTIYNLSQKYNVTPVQLINKHL